MLYPADEKLRTFQASPCTRATQMKMSGLAARSAAVCRIQGRLRAAGPHGGRPRQCLPPTVRAYVAGVACVRDAAATPARAPSTSLAVPATRRRGCAVGRQRST
eukprot:6208361-Pleurochrysis_carterae.AAC.3